MRGDRRWRVELRWGAWWVMDYFWANTAEQAVNKARRRLGAKGSRFTVDKVQEVSA